MTWPHPAWSGRALGRVREAAVGQGDAMQVCGGATAVVFHRPKKESVPFFAAGFLDIEIV